ncbi:MAG: DUF1272 domain-containing protein [Williamsia sp.]|nr:DUF1272 domain-containing protein [Williamsia sp.]
MLEIKPICEHCAKALPNGSDQAMICTFECTFCQDCVINILENVCPNCGGGFERRPTRPLACLTKFCVTNYPVGEMEYVNPVKPQKFSPLKQALVNVDPRKR